MTVQAIDIRVDDVAAATRFLSEAYGWTVLTDDPRFGELDAGGLRVMLSTEAMVPWAQAGGVILHHYVDDVPAATARAVEAGAVLLRGPLRTDWGTEAAYLEGPEGVIVDLCRDV
ncbi:glyoxalase/bleomycin resistance/extradiol dioxygenase family protein [Streptomyces sp. AC495_CC817]|uniref:VOC family protein n=1 Tax=Streptomyces sp. AC495_CC817 TaxID=2823900 RepID=UPI001C25C76A|nr:VOC family protein [Streptomyces sp. AC495_CC817]